MRETMAALFLRATGYDGAEPVVDPMCGPGTFVIEAAEMALGDVGAIANSMLNAEAAGVSEITQFTHHAVSDLKRPDGPPDLVIVNPPYGGRIVNSQLLYAIHGALGQTFCDKFHGWRVGLVTNDPKLAHATALPWKPDRRLGGAWGIKGETLPNRPALILGPARGIKKQN